MGGLVLALGEPVTRERRGTTASQPCTCACAHASGAVNLLLFTLDRAAYHGVVVLEGFIKDGDRALQLHHQRAHIQPVHRRYEPRLRFRDILTPRTQALRTDHEPALRTTVFNFIKTQLQTLR